MNFLGEAGRGTSAARTKTSLDSSGSSAGWAKLGVWHRLGTYHGRSEALRMCSRRGLLAG